MAILYRGKNQRSLHRTEFRTKQTIVKSMNSNDKCVIEKKYENKSWTYTETYISYVGYQLYINLEKFRSHY